MKHFFLLLFCMATTVFAMAQVNPSAPSKGDQAADEAQLIPHEEAAPQEPVRIDKHDADIRKQDRADKKAAFHKFLLNRVEHKLNKALSVSVAKRTGESDLGVVLYIILVVILILLILSLLEVLFPFAFTYVFGLILLILLILWILGVI